MNILLHVISCQTVILDTIGIQVNQFQFGKKYYLFHQHNNVQCKVTFLAC
jgi:hypothetical protein